MIPLREAFINKKNLHKVSFEYPNPYKVTEKDCVGKLKGMPLEILVHILETQERLRKDISYTTIEERVKNLQFMGINSAFIWGDSEEGHDFWNKIYHGNYSEFYKRYPEKRR